MEHIETSRKLGGLVRFISLTAVPIAETKRD